MACSQPPRTWSSRSRAGIWATTATVIPAVGAESPGPDVNTTEGVFPFGRHWFAHGVELTCVGDPVDLVSDTECVFPLGSQLHLGRRTPPRIGVVKLLDVHLSTVPPFLDQTPC